MSISIKTSTGGYSTITQPYYKIAAGAWLPLKKVFHKLPGGWTEIWPLERVYTHTGYGYNMNIAERFGNPTVATNYIFINNGYIGGTVGGQLAGAAANISLSTGTFPPGSTLTIINNGTIAGAGGDGAAFYSASKNVYSGTYVARSGALGLLISFPTKLTNNGFIRGGGGGGGARGEWGGKNDNHAPGCGGAGIPVGRANLTGWNPTLTGNGATDYWPGVPGTELAGGDRGGGWTGRGGGPGLAGERMTNNISKDGQVETPPGGAGTAISGYSRITSGTGLTAPNVVGPVS